MADFVLFGQRSSLFVGYVICHMAIPGNVHYIPYYIAKLCNLERFLWLVIELSAIGWSMYAA